MTWPIHWPTHPPNRPHPPMGGGVSTNHKSSNRIELSWFSQQFSNFKWFDLTPPINPPIHPPTHQIIHPFMGVGVSTDFKSSNRTEISWLVQVLFNFEWFQWSPPWVVGNGCIGVEGSERVHPTHVHIHAHAQTYDIIGNSQGFPQWGRPFAWNYHVNHMWVCVHAHACMCMCVGDIPHPPTPPIPRAAGSPKHKIQ